MPHFSFTKEIELPKEYKEKITSIDIEINKIIIILMFNKSKKKNQFYLIYSNSKKKIFQSKNKIYIRINYVYTFKWNITDNNSEPVMKFEEQLRESLESSRGNRFRRNTRWGRFVKKKQPLFRTQPKTRSKQCFPVKRRRECRGEGRLPYHAMVHF